MQVYQADLIRFVQEGMPKHEVILRELEKLKK
jgi:hypothetical protein